MATLDERTIVSIKKISIYESPIFSVSYKYAIIHLILDTGATASLAKASKCKELNIPITPTLHRAIQLDGAKLDVIGEIHIVVYRDKLPLKFSALVVKNISTDFLAGTGFHKENDIYSRMANDKIVVLGKHFYHSTPPLALSAKIESVISSDTDIPASGWDFNPSNPKSS